ncbi:hypothetical protein [Aquabacterium sp. OR-4]|uniref:hypothetical protein n=1 Tax=Aquabacterium sp. OR-4 TaxID=2978127 RepID=UPI0028C6765C|nr:hypothetical protein [Aquabacterium sp. OR-4]MDT7834768.1 hypothetical protein [Aquabacterium sp. OR-4]
MNALHWPGLDWLALAGGGNRCGWQAGALDDLARFGARLPQGLSGTRAGAAIGAAVFACAAAVRPMAMDGGDTDNAPVPVPDAARQPATQALVMPTRHDPGRPPLFRELGRTCWQPSQPVPVSTWDCRRGTPVKAAWELGRSDAAALLSRGCVTLS